MYRSGSDLSIYVTKLYRYCIDEEEASCRCQKYQIAMLLVPIRKARAKVKPDRDQVTATKLKNRPHLQKG